VEESRRDKGGDGMPPAWTAMYWRLSIILPANNGPHPDDRDAIIVAELNLRQSSAAQKRVDDSYDDSSSNSLETDCLVYQVTFAEEGEK
jgi:hypothetical protein